jgi:uncharacterized protein (TIGR03435 family)
MFVSLLSNFPVIGRIVEDRTRLKGSYDLDLTWTPGRPAQAPAGNTSEIAADPGSPSIFTALQEQLGLKLESSSGSVDVIVIDRAEPPTPD